MNVSCPHCEKQLKIGGKIEESLAQLDPGKVIKVKCAQCNVPFEINSEGKSFGIAETKKEEGQKQQQEPEEVLKKEPEIAKIIAADGRRTGKVLKPPAPPNLDWLIDGVFEDNEVVEEVPLALVLMRDSPDRNLVINSIEGIGYRAEVAASSEEAIEKMQFVNYSNVVLHSKFEGAGINSSPFHLFMTKMDMSKRRYIFYTLIGPEFKTLYNLQALSHSANLVVNDNEVKDFNIILRKVIPEYEALFGPLMEELHIQRK